MDHAQHADAADMGSVVDMVCESCGEDKTDVKQYDANPYDEDVLGICVPTKLCDECYQNLCDDI